MTEQVRIRFHLTDEEVAEMALAWLNDVSSHDIPGEADVRVSLAEEGWVIDVSLEDG